MPSNSWSGLLARSRKSGTAVTNTTAATSILPAAERLNEPSNLWEVGTSHTLRLGGRISTAASSPGTLSISVQVGSVTVFTFTTPTLATSAANLTWLATVDFITQTVDAGTGTTILGIGEFKSLAVSATEPWLAMPASSPGVGTGFDNTVSGYLDVFAAWSVASASNSIRCDFYKLFSDN